MIRSLRLFLILSLAALVLVLNPSRTPVTWLAVSIGVVFAVVFIEMLMALPADPVQVRRWLFYFPLGIMAVAPFLFAAVSEYPFREAMRTAGLTAVGPADALAYAVASHRLTR